MTVDRQMLDALVARYEQPDFIATDPIAIPHAFDDARDQEVIGLYAALLAWGRRSIILQKLEELCARMDYRPTASCVFSTPSATRSGWVRFDIAPFSRKMPFG